MYRIVSGFWTREYIKASWVERSGSAFDPRTLEVESSRSLCEFEASLWSEMQGRPELYTEALPGKNKQANKQKIQQQNPSRIPVILCSLLCKCVFSLGIWLACMFFLYHPFCVLSAFPHFVKSVSNTFCVKRNCFLSLQLLFSDKIPRIKF